MFYTCISIIPTIIFYKIIKPKLIYRIILSLLFWVFITVFCGLLSNIIFNLYCTLTDKVGYNQITDFIHYISSISEYIFLVLFTVFLYIIYKTKNTKLFKITMYSIVFIILLFVIKLCLGFAYLKMIDVT